MSYPSWRAAAQAMKEAAKRAVREGRAVSVHDALVQARFDRFLSRVFADGDRSEWLLKGGMGILARVPRSRATRDIDLSSADTGLDRAIESLAGIAARDLGDHLLFELASTKETGQGTNQPGIQTRQAIFSCRDDAGTPLGDIPIDVVVGPAPIGTVEVTAPANVVRLPQPLIHHPYRLFPIADQIADKVVATMANFGGRRSSRTKDLIDLVVIARTQAVEQDQLRRAITAKRLQSGLPGFDRFTTPEEWKVSYRKLAAATPLTADLTSLGDAERYVAEWLSPAIQGASSDQPDAVWQPGRGWLRPDAGPAPASHDPGEQVWVQPHTRTGHPVRGHFRSPRTP